jgi:hypothetical protein
MSALRGTFHMSYPTVSLRSVRIHLGKSPACRAASMGFKVIQGLESLRSDAMAGGAGATGPAPKIRHEQPTPRYFCKQKVGVGIGYGMDIPKLV